MAEGDESDGTLVNYIPEHSIVLNIEPEHLDHYKDLDEIKAVFDRLCSQTRGKIIYCRAHPGAEDVCAKYPNSVSYGWSDADYTATDVLERRGRTLFTVLKGKEELGRVGAGHTRTPQCPEFPGRDCSGNGTGRGFPGGDAGPGLLCGSQTAL